MLSLKSAVSITGIKPETLFAMIIAKDIWASYGKTLVITSCTDSKHSRGSLHYVGFAFDGRIKDLVESEKQRMLEELHHALGDDFDVVCETDHFHVEFQPKNAINFKE